jgi:hypothetical protein
MRSALGKKMPSTKYLAKYLRGSMKITMQLLSCLLQIELKTIIRLVTKHESILGTTLHLRNSPFGLV